MALLLNFATIIIAVYLFWAGWRRAIGREMLHTLVWGFASSIALYTTSPLLGADASQNPALVWQAVKTLLMSYVAASLIVFAVPRLLVFSWQLPDAPRWRRWAGAMLAVGKITLALFTFHLHWAINTPYADRLAAIPAEFRGAWVVDGIAALSDAIYHDMVEHGAVEYNKWHSDPETGTEPALPANLEWLERDPTNILPEQYRW